MFFTISAIEPNCKSLIFHLNMAFLVPAAFFVISALVIKTVSFVRRRRSIYFYSFKTSFSLLSFFRDARYFSFESIKAKLNWNFL